MLYILCVCDVANYSLAYRNPTWCLSLSKSGFMVDRKEEKKHPQMSNVHVCMIVQLIPAFNLFSSNFFLL